MLKLVCTPPKKGENGLYPPKKCGPTPSGCFWHAPCNSTEYFSMTSQKIKQKCI